jgi:FkbM family methyltransferase
MSEHRDHLLTRMKASVRQHTPASKGFNPPPEYRGNGMHARMKRLIRYPGPYLEHLLRQCVERIARMLPDRDVVIHTFWGRELNVPSRDRDARVLETLGISGSNEDALIRYLVRELKNDDVFYDIGANYGFYTALAQELIEEGAVHAFEPNPSVFTRLTQIKRERPRTVLNKLALSDREGEIPFFDCADADTSGKSTTIPEVATGHRWQYKTVMVPAMTLDAYCVFNPHPTIMKIDVGGAEGKVLTGGRRMLTATSPVIALELWSGPDLSSFSSEAVRILEELGYMPFFITSDGGVREASYTTLAKFLRTVQEETNFIFKKTSA